MEAAEPLYQKAWDELQHFDMFLFSTTSTTTGVLNEELRAAKAQYKAARQQIRKFIKDTRFTDDTRQPSTVRNCGHNRSFSSYL